ncbi:MAG: hypothetical protein SFU87_16140 [Chitinophagaceae bacterium]|nr:hypothetical protein [Chitinophagaceae bacterium]
MRILEKVKAKNIPFSWVNIDYLPDSIAKHKEIYLVDEHNKVEGLIFLFYSLFGDLKDDIVIFHQSWWDFCLDTWNFQKDEYDYEVATKSLETQKYLSLLFESDIEVGYSGCCKCKDWNKYLLIIIECIVSHQAPYSPLFFDLKNEFFFYLHHSGSVGIYYKEENEIIKRLLEVAYKEYKVTN